MVLKCIAQCYNSPVKRKATSKTARVKFAARRTPRRRKAPTGLSPEFLYFTENAKSLEAYAGEVVLISGSELVAHSPDMKIIKKVIDEQGIKRPFIYRIPSADEPAWL